MKYFLINFLITFYLIAKGTTAGTVIDNKMYISFKVGDSNVSHSVQSNVDSFVIDRVVDIKTSWQDIKSVEVSPNEKNRVLTFRLDNLGNSEDNITIEHLNDSNSTFNVDNIRVYKDTNGNGIFDSNDSLSSGTSLMPDESTLLFFVSDIGDVNGTLSYGSIVATSGAVATEGVEKQSKIDTVIRDDKSSSTGVYKLRDYFLETKKSVKVLSNDGKVHTGTELEYTIDVKIIGGKGKFDNVVITDSISSKVSYVSNSLKLNDKSLTDIKDSDVGEFLNGIVNVKAGTISNFNDTNKIAKITFKVKIK